MKNFLNHFLRLNDTTVPLENKLSDIVTFGTFVSVGVGLIQNIAIGIHWFVNSMLGGTMLVSVICFYLSRYKNRFRQIRPYFLATIGAFLAISWFANYGVRGPSLVLMAMFAVLGALLIKKRNNILFFIALAFLSTVLLLIELYHPETLRVYQSDLQLQLDLFNTYIFGIVFLALTISFFKSSYEEDREALIQTTERLERSQEEILQEKEKAEKAERAKTEFLANMSHEIRTPLNSIIGTADLLNETELTPRQQEYLETISISSRHLLGLVSDVLDMSRIDQGRLFLESQDFQLTSLMDSTLKLFSNEPKISKKQLTLNLQIAPNTPENLRGDAYRLRQVIVNLVSNAIKFSNTGTIEVKVAKKAVQVPGKICIVFEVKDHGVGIAEEDLPKLFRPFSEIKTATQHPFKGAGLGLAITHTIVTMMGGEIKVESHLNQGSTFTFCVQLEAGIPPIQIPENSGGEEGKLADIYPLSILVAEDNILNQKLIVRIMEHYGYHIDIVGNGKEVLQKLAQQDYDLIFMDVQMPELDGIGATRALRQLSTAQPYIVAMTAAAAPEDQEACFAAGMNDYVVKPISMTKIRSLIPKWKEGVREMKGER
ncbi:MAG: ATP-binding protein [Haliscomenobacter sp.]|uniref:ATP-binding protein n=1 Tax=Haliscomenobacter sp. TaxID=2717303 RepID=UPI0029A92AED|nr:ATP-binding protein [Haliscomenobacter sp.]MDX2070389.1 ATP-binding protein [Haliscomenobacter sp.]